MLQQLRRGASSLVAKLLLGLLVISFGLWGIGDIFRNMGGNTLATIGKTEISAQAFRTNYDRERQYMARRTGQALTNEQAEALGLRQRVLSQMLTEAAFDEQARRMGLQISNALIAREITQDPSFRGPSGTFDRMRFERLLYTGGYNEALYMHERTQITRRRMLAQALIGGITLPAMYEQAIHRLQNETRAADFIVLTAEKFAKLPSPDEQTLTAYYETIKPTYNREETRVLTQLVLLPGTFAKLTAVSDEDARKVYESRLEKLSTPEKRQVEQLSFQDKKVVETLAGQISGKQITELLANGKAVLNDLGLVKREDIIDPAVRDAAFKLPLNQYSGVITSQFGPMILRVTKIEPGKTKSFDEMKAEIKQEIALQHGRDALFDMHDKIEDERASGASLSEIAAKLNLQVATTPALSRQGLNENGKQVPNVNPAVLEEAFKTEAGVDNEPVQLPDQRWIWFEVAKVTPETERPLAEVRQKVIEQWLADQQRTLLTQKAKTVLANIKKGKTLAVTAKELQVAVGTAKPFTRGKPAPEFSPSATDAAFRVAVNEAGTALAADNKSRIIFVVTKSETPAAKQINPKLAENILQGLRDDLLLQFITSVQQDAGMNVNQELAERLSSGAAQ